MTTRERQPYDNETGLWEKFLLPELDAIVGTVTMGSGRVVLHTHRYLPAMDDGKKLKMWVHRGGCWRGLHFGDTTTIDWLLEHERKNSVETLSGNTLCVEVRMSSVESRYTKTMNRSDELLFKMGPEVVGTVDPGWESMLWR